MGIGHMLLRHVMNEAADEGFTKISLIVETSKPTLQEYYSQLGFVPERQIRAFGDTYNRMTVKENLTCGL